MKLKPKITLLDHFSQLTDPRIDRTKEHKLIDILTIAICGMISGAVLKDFLKDFLKDTASHKLRVTIGWQWNNMETQNKNG